MNAPPADPVGDAVVEALGDLLNAATISRRVTPPGARPAPGPTGGSAASATGPGPQGWETTITVRLHPRLARLVDDGPTSTAELVAILPGAGLRAAEQLRNAAGEGPRPGPAVRRAVRDTVAAEILTAYAAARGSLADLGDLIPEIIDYLIEVSGSRVEAHDLTHGVVVADVLDDDPGLSFRYPDDLRPAKRSPLLFDGQRSVLLVDPLGRARTELQRHRLHRLGGASGTDDVGDAWAESGSLVAAVTAIMGGVGFYVRADRSIWTFVDGRPLLVRRGEHWTAFPVELAASISHMIDGGRAATVVARAAYAISTRPQGAILAIVDDAAAIDGVVSRKDRYDLRAEIDPLAMRPETRLHHLIDADELDEQTLARLASLDGAAVVDRDAHLIAYGAIVTSADSEHEGARTAAARTLSQAALVVLKVSVDGDITIFREGAAVTTLLGSPSNRVG